MATMESFYEWLISLFKEGEHLQYDDIKHRMEEAGYGDVKAEDVYNAVNTMIDDGDVFTNEQTSTLEAYTGGNNVSQGAYQPSGAASGGSAAGGSSVGSSVGGASSPAGYAAPASVPVPPPPPLESPAYESDLEAAVNQILYVNNVTNNTYNEDNDYFSDDDTVVDSSVNQNIVAAGDVNQDFDTVTATGQSVAAGGDIEDSAVIAGDVSESVVSGDDTYLENSQVGGEGNVNLQTEGGDVNAPIAAGGGDATQAEQIAGGDAIQAEDSAVATGGGDAISDSQANTGSGDLINDSNANTGDGDFTQTNVEAYDSEVNANVNAGDNNNLVDADDSVASAEGDVEGINQSDVEAAEFGEGDLSADDNIVQDSEGVGLNTGDYGEADGEFTETYEEQYVDIEDSAGIGVSDDGPAEGEFAPELEVDVDLEGHDAHHDPHEDLADV